ncbi:MAG TPA: Holliday junction branch migration protein RuvA [Gemmatimonadaceae bacterium]|jgi:Holliday junction DNA helicase RuvA|nr:Holliday junction branch migration protein RuvA [Gemmatimonadaceae bacterium]
MISRIHGRLAAKEIDHLEIMVAGVGYEIAVPLSVYEKLPPVGEEVALCTHLVVKEDAWQLFGFSTPRDRRIFRALLGAKGVGPALALALLSALNSDRLVRAIREKDIATLQTVPRVGRKKAEQLVLDLADKLDDVAAADDGPPGAPLRGTAEDAIRGLVSLGYARPDAERAVRAAAGDSVADIVRQALRTLAGSAT